MPYKTIALALIQEEPALYQTLRQRREVLLAMEASALRLKHSHEEWMELIGRKRPDSDSRQISSEAMEFAIQDLRDHLHGAWATSAAALPGAPSILSHPPTTRPA